MDLVDLIMLVEERGKELAEFGYKQAHYDQPVIHYLGGYEKSLVQARVTRVNTAFVDGRVVEEGTIPVVFWPSHHNSTHHFGLVLGYVKEVIKTGPLGRRVAKKMQTLPYRWLLLLTLKENGEPDVYIQDTDDEPTYDPITRKFKCFQTHMNLLDLRGEKANILCRYPERKYIKEEETIEEMIDGMVGWAD